MKKADDRFLLAFFANLRCRQEVISGRRLVQGARADFGREGQGRRGA